MKRAMIKMSVLLSITIIWGCGLLDSDPPVVEIISPAAEEIVNGEVIITVSVEDESEINWVNFYINGEYVGDDSTSPYEYIWDTSWEDMGPHELYASAEDENLNEGESDISTVYFGTNFLGGTNSAIISGVNVGAGVVDNALLSKTVPVTIVTGIDDLSFSSASVSQSSLTSSFIYSVIPVTNTHAYIPYRAVKSSIISFQNSNGVTVLEVSYDYAYGSVYDNYYGWTNNDWLAPGETGYFMFSKYVDSDIYDEITAIQIYDVTADSYLCYELNSLVLPVSYTIESEDLLVTGYNSGSASAQVYYSSKYILLDENEQPLHFSYLYRPDSWSGWLLSNTSNALNDSYRNYQGTATKILPLFDYYDYSSTGKNSTDIESVFSPAEPDPEEQQRLQHTARNTYLNNRKAVVNTD